MGPFIIQQEKPVNLQQLLGAIQSTPDAIEFNDVMAVIAQNYVYTPTAFSNGIGDERVDNPAGSNEGSCRLFAFARLRGLDKAQTLACFGAYYRDDVLGNPHGDDHANIRAFILDGPAGITFEGVALRPRD